MVRETVPAEVTDPSVSNNSDDAQSIAVLELTFHSDFEEGDFSEWDSVVGGV